MKHLVQHVSLIFFTKPRCPLRFLRVEKKAVLFFTTDSNLLRTTAPFAFNVLPFELEIIYEKVDASKEYLEFFQFVIFKKHFGIKTSRRSRVCQVLKNKDLEFSLYKIEIELKLT